MTLAPGTRLDAYEVLSALGAGHVAIKILPEAFAQDAGRLARFEREARTLFGEG